MVRQVLAAPVTRSVSDEERAGDEYVEKILKLIPAETVAVYLSLDGVLSSALSGQQLRIWLWVIFVLVLVGNILYLRRAKVTAVSQLTLMSVAFGIWVLALGGPFALFEWYRPFMGSVVLTLFTFFLAPLYRGVPLS